MLWYGSDLMQRLKGWHLVDYSHINHQSEGPVYCRPPHWDYCGTSAPPVVVGILVDLVRAVIVAEVGCR
jgi:hypothetical protein